MTFIFFKKTCYWTFLGVSCVKISFHAVWYHVTSQRFGNGSKQTHRCHHIWLRCCQSLIGRCKCMTSPFFQSYPPTWEPVKKEIRHKKNSRLSDIHKTLQFVRGFFFFFAYIREQVEKTRMKNFIQTSQGFIFGGSPFCVENNVHFLHLPSQTKY